MIWIVDEEKGESYNVCGTNIHVTKTGMFQLWGTKSPDKTILIMQNETQEEVKMLKDAIDYAVNKGVKTFTI